MLWFGMNGTEVCSGMCAQALVRGWANFTYDPASMTPKELWRALTSTNWNVGGGGGGQQIYVG